MLAALHLVGVGEAFMLGKKSGVALPALWAALKASAGNSYVLETEARGRGALNHHLRAVHAMRHPPPCLSQHRLSQGPLIGWHASAHQGARPFACRCPSTSSRGLNGDEPEDEDTPSALCSSSRSGRYWEIRHVHIAYARA